MEIVAKRIMGRKRQGRNGTALRILRASVSRVELRHEPFQVHAPHAAVEGIHRCSGQQVILGAIAVKVDPADVRAERRCTGVGKIETELESPRQPRNPGEIGDLREVIAERAAVLKPVVQIEPVARIGSNGARNRHTSRGSESPAKSVSRPAVTIPYTRTGQRSPAR